MKTNSKIKILSIILSFCIIVVSLPLTVIAQEELIKNSDFLEKIQTEEITSLQEDISYRDKFTKHYVDSEGQRYAVIFPEQVHYEENEIWKEVDNTLTLNAESGIYESKNQIFKTGFSKQTDMGNLVRIEDGNYTLSWRIDFATDNKAQIASTGMSLTANHTIANVNANVSSGVDLGLKTVDNISDMGKVISEVRYNNVFNNTVDLRYSILHGKVEEDIILRSPEDFTSYTLTVNTGGLIATKQADGSVLFTNAQKEKIFVLGAPWMKDSDVAVSNEIEVNVYQNGTTAYISYTPNLAWLNDESRVYPVLIDPSFTTRNYTSNYKDTYVFEGDSASTTRPTETTMKVGNINGNTHYSYVKILNIPYLYTGWTIDEATLNFWVNTTSSPSLSLYNVTEAWNPTTITYSNQPSSTLITSGVSGVATGNYSKYTFDITNWLNVIKREHYDIYSYFCGNNWHGFKIGYTNETANNYTQIMSSEYAQSYRPTMTLKYTYTYYGGLEDGAVYSLVNRVYNIFNVTVHNGNTTNGTNVYQYQNNNSLSQAFRLDFDDDKECFVIRAMCSNDGYGSVVSFSYNTTIDPSNGYTYANAYLGAYSPGLADNYEWLIYPVEKDFFKIVSRADPDLCLMPCMGGNGTANGTTNTSTGNIIVAEYAEDLSKQHSQHWKIVSGGCQILDGYNIKDAYATNETYTVNEGAEWLKFCCPVTNFGETVTWSSSNALVAEVDTNGAVTAKLAGKTTITATVLHTDGTTDTYSCTVFVVLYGGDYYINNKQYSEYMQTQGTSGVSISNFDSSSSQKWNIASLFNGYYKITSKSSGKAITAPTSTNGAITQSTYTGAYNQQWEISAVDFGKYRISPRSNSSYCIAIGTDGSSVQMKTSQNNNSDKWDFIQVSDFTFVGIPDYSHNHSHETIFHIVDPLIYQMGYYSSKNLNKMYSSSIISYMETSKIFFARAHGSQTSIMLTDGTLTTSMLNSIDAEAFSNCDLVLYGSCLTGKGGDDETNLVNKTHAKGAKTVIGFEEEVICTELDLWCKTFFESLEEGDTIETACDEATAYVKGEYPLTTTASCYIAGDKTATLN